jgi:hypothetical protein
MSRLRLTAADLLAATIGGLVGLVIALGICESVLRRGARS